MDELKLCESDYRFMDVIWENEPLPSRELVELCARELGWKKSTTYTTLKKLCDKGFAKNEETVVSAIIPRDRVRAYESERFLERTFGGSLPAFLTAFTSRKKLSEEEIEQLQRLIDESRGVRK